MNPLKLTILLILYSVEVRADPPQSFSEMRSIVELGVTVDLSGSWWTSDICARYDLITFCVQENLILKGGHKVGGLIILFAVAYNGKQYRVGDVKTEQDLQSTVYSFKLQHHRGIFKWNCSKKEMQAISSHSMSLYIKVEDWSMTIPKEAFQVVSVGRIMVGYRINRTKLLGAQNVEFSSVVSELKMASTVVIDPSNTSDRIDEFRITLEDSIYFFFNLADKLKRKSTGYNIEVSAKYGGKHPDETKIGSIVEVYTTDTDKAEKFLRIAVAPKDVIRKPNYKSTDDEELVGKETEWIFISIN